MIYIYIEYILYTTYHFKNVQNLNYITFNSFSVLYYQVNIKLSEILLILLHQSIRKIRNSEYMRKSHYICFINSND